MMQQKQSIEGIIIRSVNYGDAHKIITIFTPNKGIITCTVYGARKTNNKFRGKIELLNWVDGTTHFSQKTKLITLEEVNLKYSFSAHFSFESLWEVISFLKFLFILEFTIEEENIKIFSMFIKFLKLISEVANQISLKVLIASFVLKSLIILGLFQNPKTCYLCGSDGANHYFLLEEGFFICLTCRKLSKKSIKKLNSDQNHLLLKLVYKKFEDIFYYNYSEKEVVFIEDIMDLIVYHHLGKNWKYFQCDENPFHQS